MLVGQRVLHRCVVNAPDYTSLSWTSLGTVISACMPSLLSQTLYTLARGLCCMSRSLSRFPNSSSRVQECEAAAFLVGLLFSCRRVRNGCWNNYRCKHCFSSLSYIETSNLLSTFLAALLGVADSLTLFLYICIHFSMLCAVTLVCFPALS